MSKLFIVLMLFSPLSFAQKEIRIGCAYTCDRDVQTSLKQISKQLSLTLKIIDLSIQKKVDWKNLDGIIIPGGEDIDPKYYLSRVETELQEYTRSLDHLVEYTQEGRDRDPFEYALVQDYFKKEDLKDFPLLGICRGMQMMAVSLGIPLYVDIKTELGIENRRDVYDRINIFDPNSFMREIFPALNLLGYKYHHQGIRMDYYKKHADRWPHVKVTAYSNNGLVAESLEAIERPALGIQFHPEADNNSVRKSIFSWFLKKASLKKSADQTHF